MPQMSSELVLMGLAWYAVFTFSLTFHEAAHAFMAMKLGDHTAFHGGLVSLNPMMHMSREPFGMVILPILTYFMNGWMIGWASTPYDTVWARQYPKRKILMSLAGPAANLILVIIAGVIIKLGVVFGMFSPPESIGFSHLTDANFGWAKGLAAVFSILFTLNLVLLIFNLLPVPPLDGSSLVPLFLSGEIAYKYNELLRRPGASIVGLVIAWQVFGPLFSPIHLFVINLLYPGLNYG
jgi:Zn-dependent protease